MLHLLVQFLPPAGRRTATSMRAAAAATTATAATRRTTATPWWMSVGSGGRSLRSRCPFVATASGLSTQEACPGAARAV